MDRPHIRLVATALAALTALLYFVVATPWVSVVAADDEPDVLFATAGLVFVIGTLLLLRFDERRLWVAGTLVQLFFIAAYFSVAPDREPAYEPWGIAIRVVQLLLLVALAALALRPVPEEAHEPISPAELVHPMRH